MKTRHILLVILLALVAGFAGARLAGTIGTAENVKAETTYARVVRTNTIKCGYAISPPDMMKDANTGQLSGIDVDIWNAVGKLLDVKIEWVEETGWGNFIEGLNARRYDTFCSLVWANPGRAKNMVFSRPLFYSFLDMYTRTDDHRFDGDIEKLNDPGVTLPAVEGDVSVDMAKSRFPQARILLLPPTATLADVYLSVVTGKADAIYLEPSMVAPVTKENDEKLRKVESPVPAYTFANYYGFQADDAALRDMVNVAFQTIVDDGQLEAILAKYGTYKVARKSYQ